MVVSGGVVTTRRGSLTPPLPPRARSARQTHYTTYNMRKGGGEWTRRVRHDRNCPFPFPTWTRTHVRNNSGGSGGGTRVPRQSGAGRTRYNNNTSVWKLISNRRARNAIKIYTLLLRGRGVCITDNFARMKIGYRGERRKNVRRETKREFGECFCLFLSSVIIARTDTAGTASAALENRVVESDGHTTNQRGAVLCTNSRYLCLLCSIRNDADDVSPRWRSSINIRKKIKSRSNYTHTR